MLNKTQTILTTFESSSNSIQLFHVHAMIVISYHTKFSH